ncbi:MAG TPA: aminotransferase class I/II-fold pyridoxal phosphate-dependent enzyme [Polyangiaceae bacterium]|nr:aminotransferase class I/II-fold pyridoxal phosphate-dependent enzyme [Polyangiaceae bacterium]
MISQRVIVPRSSLSQPSMDTPTAWPFPRTDTLPPYGFGVTDAVKARVIAQGADLIDLGLGNPDRPIPPEIVERLQEAIGIAGNHRYFPGRGLEVLRRALAAWYARRYGVGIDPEHEIVVTLGAKEGMSHLCLALLQAGDVAIVPTPCFPIHAGAPRIAGAEVELYEVTSGLEPAAAIRRAIERVRARGKRPKLVIANYPHNPTGLSVTPEQMRELLEVVERSGALLMHDLAYADCDFGARYAPSVFSSGLEPERVKRFAVEVFSMSKSYNMPGWRIAFMAGNQRMIDALAHLKTYLDYGAFAPLQQAAAWALDHGDELASRFRHLYHTRAKALVSGLREAGFSDAAEPSGTMFVWCRLPVPLAHQSSAQAACELIEHAHVATSAGSGFGPGGEGFLRFALIQDPPRIREACRRLGLYLQPVGA